MEHQPETNTHDGTTSFESTTKAALTLQKVYRGYRARRKLADTAVVAEELWWRAIDYARLNHSTVSFFDFKKPETAASRWNRVGLNASKVGKGLSKDSKALKLAFQHWIEAIDPRHRYGHSLHLYYEEWRKADSGQPFFYWLDIGDGREVDLKVCPRSKLKQQSIIYLGPQERRHYEYIVIGGKVVHKQSREYLDTFEGQKGGMKWIYVMSPSKKLYIGKKKKGIFHHSSFLAGGATLTAGRLVCENGNLKSISAYSGHYRPTGEKLSEFLAILEENGIDLSKVEIHQSDESENYDIPIQEENANEEVLSKPEPSAIVTHKMSKSTEISKPYQRTLSGVLQSPRGDVPKDKILLRINSKKSACSYQLGHQLSMKWSTGAGPRIGCVADYPMELRVQALEVVNCSPRASSSPLSFPVFAGFAPSTPLPTSESVVVL